MCKQKIVSALQRFGRWVRYWLWEVPVAKPVPLKPTRLKATEVYDEYVIVVYDGQKISLHKSELVIWNDKRVMTRKEKRAMKAKYEKMEKSGQIRFDTINGKEVCIKNKDYQALADKTK